MRTLRRVAACTFLGMAYVIAGKAGLALAVVNSSATAVWAPTGIALAALLVFGARVWPVFFTAAFIVNQTTAGSWVTSLLIAAGNTGEAVLGSYLVRRFAQGCGAFNRVADVFKFVLLGGLVSTMVSATVGVTTLTLHGFAAWGAYAPIWTTWWLGNATGAIVVAPTLVVWLSTPRPRWSGRQQLELALLIAATALVGALVLIEFSRPLTFLCIPLCIWAAFRFGQREASALTGCLSLIALWGAVHHMGPFDVQSPNAALLSAQAFAAVSMMVGLVIGAAMRERERIEEELEAHVISRTADLEATQMRLAEAQEVAHIGSWEWNVATGRLWWSPELYRISGVDRHAFTPSYQAFLDSVHRDDRGTVHNAIQQALHVEEPFEFQFRLITGDGEERVVFSKGRVVRDARSGSVRMVGTAQDVTERSQLEMLFRQSQKLEAVGLLAGGIAHDFNNLITAIGGYTELVLGRLPADDPRRGDLIEVQKAVDRATALTRRLLAFSRRQQIEPRIVDLNSLVRSMESLLRRTIGEQIELVLQLDADLEPVRADPGQLEQVILNLALNARDAMPTGGRLRFATNVADFEESWTRLRPPMTPGRYVHLSVTDTGIGMSPEIQSRIFEPFFTTKAAGKGTGFGLATVYSIIKQSGGFIWVTSQVGRGSSFDIALPVVPHAAVDAIEPIASRDAASRGSETILVVEDDRAVRRLARTVLEASGYTVLDARDGEEALVLVQGLTEPIDLLIADVVMPGIKGPELATRLKSDWHSLRVLYTSGYSLEAAARAGIDDETPFLAKPFLPIDLLEQVRQVLAGGQGRRRALTGEPENRRE